MPEHVGRRVYPDEQGNLILKEGDYGCDGRGVWCVRPPGCHAGGIPHHTVTEHEDKTVSVNPSIVLDHGTMRWHGWLKKGVWKW